MGWNKVSLTGKAKAMDTNKAKQGIYSLPVNRQAFSHLQENSGSVQLEVTWEEKYSQPKHCPFLPSSPSFVCWAQCHNGLEYPCGQLLSQLWPLPAPRAPQVSSPLGQPERQRKPWHCKHCSATAKPPLCYLLSVLIHCSQQFFNLKGNWFLRLSSSCNKTETLTIMHSNHINASLFYRMRQVPAEDQLLLTESNLKLNFPQED